MMSLTLPGDHINDSGSPDKYCPIGKPFQHNGYEEKRRGDCVHTAEGQKNGNKLGNNPDF